MQDFANYRRRFESFSAVCLKKLSLHLSISKNLSLRFRHPHDLLSYPISFLLVDISRDVNREFRLKPDRSFREYRCPAEIVAARCAVSRGSFIESFCLLCEGRSGADSGILSRKRR